MSTEARLKKLEAQLAPARTVLPPLHSWDLDAYRAPDGTLDDAKVREYAGKHPGALVLGNPWRETLAEGRP